MDDYPVRDDITASQYRAWARIAGAGTWWSGAERVAIAAETRRAADCALCRARREALSPRAIAGDHEHLGALSVPAVEAIHAIRTDPGRLTRDWHRSVLADGISVERYVELAGVVVTVVMVDSFHLALGRPAPDLPKPVAGRPSEHRPAGARVAHHWVPTLSPDEVTAADPDLYAGGRGANIHRALSLVPEEVIGFFDLGEAHYLDVAKIRHGAPLDRAIDRAQIELLAARVSALNQCVY